MFSKLLDKLKIYLTISRVTPIARRCFVKNGFDGAMTTLGIIIGSYASGALKATMIIFAGFGASVAMGISGFLGTYLTEKAERVRILKDLERAMLKKLGKSLVGRATKFAYLWVAFIDCSSPILTAIIGIAPFFLASFEMIPLMIAFYLSLGMALAILFALGTFLGKIAGEDVLLSGIRALLAGIATILIFMTLKL
jgi:predicted membrane protein (TIGR00267 family)